MSAGSWAQMEGSGINRPLNAMRVASRSMVPKLELMNRSKPNQDDEDQAAKFFANMDRNLKPPGGVKLDISDPLKMTTYIKKAAAFFGADLVGVCLLERRWLYSHTYDTKKGEDRYKADMF